MAGGKAQQRDSVVSESSCVFGFNGFPAAASGRCCAAALSGGGRTTYKKILARQRKGNFAARAVLRTLASTLTKRVSVDLIISG